MCPVGRLYTHVPSWAIVHSCAQLGDCTHMCPVGRLYTHVPSWAIVYICVQLGNGIYTHVLSIMLHTQLGYIADCYDTIKKMVLKAKMIAITKPTAGYSGVVYIDLSATGLEKIVMLSLLYILQMCCLRVCGRLLRVYRTQTSNGWRCVYQVLLGLYQMFV